MATQGHVILLQVLHVEQGVADDVVAGLLHGSHVLELKRVPAASSTAVDLADRGDRARIGLDANESQ